MGRLVLLLGVAFVVYLWSHPRQRQRFLTRIPPAAIGLLALLYLISPVDLIPDFVGPGGFVDDIIVLISALWWARQRSRGPSASGSERRRSSRPRPDSTREAVDAYAILDVSRGASRDEITHAYREQMKRYHPDRVATLGEEMQRLAHEKTIEIQRAYEQLRS